MKGDAAPSVLWKAFDVLGAFSQRRRVLTLAEIARYSGLAKSTAHRVLAMLVCAQGAATILCRSSADALARAAGRESIDTRRFRMTIELDGCEPFAEDGWIGRTLFVADVALRRIDFDLLLGRQKPPPKMVFAKR